MMIDWKLAAGSAGNLNILSEINIFLLLCLSDKLYHVNQLLPHSSTLDDDVFGRYAR